MVWGDADDIYGRHEIAASGRPILWRIFLLTALRLHNKEEKLYCADASAAGERHVRLLVAPQLELTQENGVANHVDAAKNHVQNDEDDRDRFVRFHRVG